MTTFLCSGIKIDVREEGGAWKSENGYVQESGIKKFLYAKYTEENPLTGDFIIGAKLSLAELNHTAATFDLAGNHFGFDGNRNKLFTEGQDFGRLEFHGDASEYITPGKIFSLNIIREKDKIHFKIKGKKEKIIEMELDKKKSLYDIGFRPWRNTMRIYSFFLEDSKDSKNDVVSNQIHPLDVFDVFVNGTHGYDTYRIPAIIRAGNGDLLAFAEGRVKGHSDFGNIDIVMRRSKTNGSSWEPPLNEKPTVVVDTDSDDFDNINVGKQAGNPSVVVDQKDNNKIILIFNTGNAHENEIVEPPPGREEKLVREVWVKIGTNNGKIWNRKPINITTSVHKPKAPKFNPAYNFSEDWRWHAVGPGHGIQLSNGRLVFGANYKLKDDISTAFTLYSDDHGSNWKIGLISKPPRAASESQLVQLSNGDIMMNARPDANDCKFRRISRSIDSGENWSSFNLDNNLPDPIVHGSIIRLPNNSRTILFCNPASSKRENLTVRVSHDEGKTWPDNKTITIQQKESAYSDLVIQSNDSIGVLYEDNKERSIRYTRFSLEQLTTN